MAASLPLPLQTMYAELVERCAVGALREAVGDYPLDGAFVRQVKNGRTYWYFQAAGQEGGRRQRYIGPETEDLVRLIEAHRAAKGDVRERRQMVSALKRAGLTGPDMVTGRVLAALASAGAFRLRAVVVGTIAYQIYGGLLGVRLSGATQTTADHDIAQFRTISIAVDDTLDLSLHDVLLQADPAFRPLPDPNHPRFTTRFALGDRYRVDILTPNRGPDDDAPVPLPALQAAARPLRFLDFLLYQEERAVALHAGGVLVNVPAPERFALHKLIVSRLRIESRESQEKARKDLRQAAELLSVLAEVRPFELAEAWEDLRERGPKWRRHADEALVLAAPAAREALERAQSLAATAS